MNRDQIHSLKQRSITLRESIIRMLEAAGSGHTGGSLSSIDIMNVLYNSVMKHNPDNPDWEDRDRFFLSKGHVCPALYAVLADCGYFPTEELLTLRQFGSRLQGHPCMQKTPGIECSSGSLGQGLSVSIGIALAMKLDGRSNRTYCLMGDGETQEGEVWEAAMAAAHYGLDNLCAIVDHNHLQIDGRIEDVLSPEEMIEKWKAFNWNVLSIDGHDIEALYQAFQQAESCKGKPTVLICETIKGKGVSFMENDPSWHGVTPNAEQAKQALQELEESRAYV